MSEPEHVIIGTAGHIDHGKTLLVKALTGIDADTLAEEKQRGITIELGFVFMETPGCDRQIVKIRISFWWLTRIPHNFPLFLTVDNLQ